MYIFNVVPSHFLYATLKTGRGLGDEAIFNAQRSITLGAVLWVL